MNPMQRQVAEFHNALEVPAREIPTNLPRDERALRARLILEETLEVIEALGFAPVYDYETRDWGLSGNLPQRTPDQVKELCDLLYVVFGTAITMGVDLVPFFNAVHENNMTKVGGEVRADGKRLKPAGYKPVNLTHVMRQVLESKCRTCREYNGSGPPHFASTHCESGGYNHCTCDTCF